MINYVLEIIKEFNRKKKIANRLYCQITIIHCMLTLLRGDRKIWYSCESATTIVFCLTQPHRYSALEISLIVRDKIAAWILINGTFAKQRMSVKKRFRHARE